MTKLKIYGERNSGTNYLSKLIDLNLEVKQLPGTVPGYFNYFPSEKIKNLYFHITYPLNLGWKHAIPKADISTRSKGVKVIFLIKNPYSFLLSLYKRPYHQKHLVNINKEEFLRAKWYPVGRARMDQKELSSPVELWNRKVASYLEFCKAHPKDSLLMRYEDIITNPEKALALITRKFGFEKKTPFFVNLESAAKRNDKKSFDIYKNYYLHEKWKKKLSLPVLNIINSKLDDKIVYQVGYKLLDPTALDQDGSGSS